MRKQINILKNRQNHRKHLNTLLKKKNNLPDKKSKAISTKMQIELGERTDEHSEN